MNISLLSSRWGRRLGKELAKPPRVPKPTFETSRWNIVKGDQVTQGPQTGQRGKVLEVLRKANRISIEGVNMVSQPFFSLAPTKTVVSSFCFSTEKSQCQGQNEWLAW